MDYEFNKGCDELTREGQSMQTYLLSSKYPRITISVGSVSLWDKFWNWLLAQ